MYVLSNTSLLFNFSQLKYPSRTSYTNGIVSIELVQEVRLENDDDDESLAAGVDGMRDTWCLVSYFVCFYCFIE